ncbi:MAG: hypothetical protein JW986_04365 [Methanotrichaceae archaeon]|nr:hypothetical protein [Methanotrichaceae archaeon]
MQDDQIICPACGEASEHVTVKMGREHLVRCGSCGTVFPLQLERVKIAVLKVMVSREGSTKVYLIEVPATEELYVGQEMLVDDKSHDLVLAQITSLETDRRVEKAQARSVKAAWARAVDDVALKVSVFKDGKTRSIKLAVSGEESYSLGQILDSEAGRCRVEKIKLRQGGFADEAKASEITRIWGKRL